MLKFFLGEHAPEPPLVARAFHAHWRGGYAVSQTSL